ncbi:uncharacterized protein LOC123475684 [Daphnia magna]|uniref:uncharacterized protein LOC123475684 n=1 Tax=Daphnia magna TaxID=35525 RepID=UPI001E1BBE39|nr:uncharacterized protein LOC123475684 [Daphnia magna]
MWDGETDMLTFKIRKQPSHDVLTKRTFLSIISSVYVGFVAPVVFLMKSLLQDIWAHEKRIGWDDPIPEESGQCFHYFYEHLDNLELLTVLRCFRHQRGRWTQQHLHFHFVFEDQSTTVSFVMAKTHVTPVKGLTIPRLELQAAVEGLNIALVICRELEIDLGEVTFHTDSQTDPQKHESKTMASRFWSQQSREPV